MSTDFGVNAFSKSKIEIWKSIPKNSIHNTLREENEETDVRNFEIIFIPGKLRIGGLIT